MVMLPSSSIRFYEVALHSVNMIDRDTQCVYTLPDASLRNTPLTDHFEATHGLCTKVPGRAGLAIGRIEVAWRDVED